MTTRREFVGTVGTAAAAAMFIPFKFIEAELFFDMATMETTHVYPLSTPLTDLWPNKTYGKAVMDELDAWRLTRAVVDYFQKESIEAYLIDCPTAMIAGKPHYAKTRKLKCRWEPGCSEVGMEELGREFAWEVKGRIEALPRFGGEFRSVGIMGFGATPLAMDQAFCQRRGIVGRYLISKTPAREVLRLAELTRKCA